MHGPIMPIMRELHCAVCGDVARFRVTVELPHIIGLYMAHLIGEHWEWMEARKAELPPVTSGAWKRIAEGLL